MYRAEAVELALLIGTERVQQRVALEPAQAPELALPQQQQEQALLCPGGALPVPESPELWAQRLPFSRAQLWSLRPQAVRIRYRSWFRSAVWSRRRCRTQWEWELEQR